MKVCVAVAASLLVSSQVNAQSEAAKREAAKPGDPIALKYRTCLADTSAQSRAKGASIDEFNALLRTACPDEAKALRIRLTELARSRGTTDEPTIDKIIESSLLLVQKIYSMDYAGEKPPIAPSPRPSFSPK